MVKLASDEGSVTSVELTSLGTIHLGRRFTMTHLKARKLKYFSYPQVKLLPIR